MISLTIIFFFFSTVAIAISLIGNTVAQHVKFPEHVQNFTCQRHPSSCGSDDKPTRTRKDKQSIAQINFKGRTTDVPLSLKI